MLPYFPYKFSTYFKTYSHKIILDFEFRAYLVPHTERIISILRASHLNLCRSSSNFFLFLRKIEIIRQNLAEIKNTNFRKNLGAVLALLLVYGQLEGRKTKRNVKL